MHRLVLLLFILFISCTNDDSSQSFKLTYFEALSEPDYEIGLDTYGGGDICEGGDGIQIEYIKIYGQ